MKSNIITFAGIGLLIVFAVGLASLFEIRLASAQVNATSSPPSLADSTTTLPTLQTSTSSTPSADAASSTPGVSVASASTVAANTPAASTLATQPPPQGLTLVHMVGTKYTDYFTDGSTTIAVPGDSVIDGHLSDPGAPLPTHEGMTWVHTTGASLYDTPSGDLEVGDYAVQADGSYIDNAPPFVSSTSTPAAMTPSGPAAPDTPASTMPSPTDKAPSTTTSAESTT